VCAKAKICGITRPEDAELAVAAGASFLGVVFAGGPRMIGADRAAEIVAAAGGTPVLGVFSRQPLDDILRVSEIARLWGIQLHGPYPSETAAHLKARGLGVWRVARVTGPDDLRDLGEIVPHSDAVLVERRVAGMDGGSGLALELALARDARIRLAGHTMVLAGGLTPETVAEAVTLVRPEVADVSSGVERQPGIKDPDKIARFLEAVIGHSAFR
jgi:phosphoribosylanthranilate isomerase